VTIPLRAEDLKYWSEADRAFVLERGEVQIMIGAASDDIRLKGKMAVR
jgi:beta-glucosidase